MVAERYTFEQRVTAFWSKVNKDGPKPPDHPDMDNCWIWEGCVSSRNYGTFCIGGVGAGQQQNKKSHQVAWFLTYGYWPNEIDHLCHVTLCTRVSHMRDLETHQENINNRRCTFVCKRGHEIKDPNLYRYTSNGVEKKRCLACYKAEQIRAKERRLAAKANQS